MVNKFGKFELRPGGCMFDGERWLVAVYPFDCVKCALLGSMLCDLVDCIPDEGPDYHLVEGSVEDYINQQARGDDK